MKRLSTALALIGLVLLSAPAFPAGAETLAQTPTQTPAEPNATTTEIETPVAPAVEEFDAKKKTKLEAQINALMGKLEVLQKSSVPSTAAFTQDLGVGSTGAQVVLLQQFLTAENHLAMPEGVAYGYFGELTRMAVASWQGANGVTPASGYWGPVSRARSAASLAAASTLGVAAASSTPEVITTPGVEGTLSAALFVEEVATTTATSTATTTVEVVEESPVSTSTALSVQNDKVKVLDIELTASTSDIKVERIHVQLGENEDIYQDITAKVHVMENGVILASRDLDKLTVVEDKDDMLYTSISGMNLVVRKDTPRVISIVIEARHSINSVTKGSEWTLTIPVEGIRGIDGTGANVFAPEAGFSGTFSVEPIVEAEE